MTSTTDKNKAADETPAAGSLSSGEIVDDLTGFDEQAIKAQFGATIGALSDDESPTYDGIQFLRACLFAHYRHKGLGGKNDVERFHAVQSIRFGDLKGLFKADEDELPGSDEGKAETP